MSETIGSCDVQVEGSHATFTTERMIAEVDGGVITRIFNRLTGTEYMLNPEAALPSDYSTALVYYKPVRNDRGEEALVPAPVPLGQLPQVQCSREEDGGVAYTLKSNDGETTLTLSYALDTASDDLLVSQKAQGSRKALGAVRFGLGPVTCRGDLLLPCYHGMKANMTDEFLHWEGNHWQWPWVWPLQLIIFDDTPGGFWVHARDTKGLYKDLHYRYEGEAAWLVAFDTFNFTPLADHTSVESVTWRINTYEGDWAVPVDQYKAWAYDAYDIAGKAFARPDWVDDIRIQIKHADYIPEAQIEPYLDILAELVKPEQTLLFMTRWNERTDPFIYPNWKLTQKGKKFNEEARKRGFRTMYFSNFWGISPDHPRLEEFRPYLIRNLYRGQYEGWNLRPDDWSRAGGSVFQLYYVNPASKKWREFQISEYKALFEASWADGLFLDQTYNIWNDYNGPIDGMTMIEGNIAFHRELAEALPGVALGGENISEITFQYESFFEMHPLSFEYMEDDDGKYRWKIWPQAFPRMVPIMSRFVMPHTRPMGYLGFPDTSSKFYPGWRDAVERYGGIPTITRPTYEEMRDPNSEVRRVMRQAMMHGDR